VLVSTAGYGEPGWQEGTVEFPRLASFPGLLRTPPVSFIACGMQKQMEKAWRILPYDLWHGWCHGDAMANSHSYWSWCDCPLVSSSQDVLDHHFSMHLLLEHAADQSNRQFIFFTPQDPRWRSQPHISCWLRAEQLWIFQHQDYYTSI